MTTSGADPVCGVYTDSHGDKMISIKRVREQWNADEYSELKLWLRAFTFMMPVLFVMLAWGEPWIRSCAAWILASVFALLYGRWVRNDAEDSDD